MTTPYNSESATTPGPSLTGLLMCEHCRTQMLPHSIGPEWTQPQYVCPATQGKHPTGCMTPTLPCGDLDRRVLDKITSHLLKDELIPDLISAVKEDVSRASTKHTSGAEQKCTTREVIGQRKCPRQLFGRGVTEAGWQQAGRVSE